MLSPLDDLPVHQIAQPISIVATSDRNFYDRYYFNAFDREAELFVTAGFALYPNLGVADGFLAATCDGHQYVVRASRELTADRSDTSVGPISIEVIEGLQRLRLRVDAHEGPVSADLTWSPAIPAFLEARHLNRRGARIITDTCRFMQTGYWSGALDIEGRSFEISPTRWGGGRDRSWGIRPVGEPEPIGRRMTSATDGSGFLWLYATMQFPDFSILCMIQEDRTGRRSIEQAMRLWPTTSGREPEDLGGVEHELIFAPGSRRIERARLTFSLGDDEPLTIKATPVSASYLSLGTGYGFEADWRHGMYQGPLVVQSRTYDLSDPDVVAASYGLVDNLARFDADGLIGHGLFENAVLGANDRYGLSSRR
jgi:hypothetical protein